MFDGTSSFLLLTKSKWAFSAWGIFILKGMFTLIGAWWHSLLIAKKRVKDWDRISGKSKGNLKIRTRFRKFLHNLVAPARTAIKLFLALSTVLTRVLNLKGEPRTMNQIVRTAG